MILFLDFDGVLHPQYEDRTIPIEVAFCNLPLFESVMRDFSDVAIVISSTWRLQFSLDKLRAWFSPDIAQRIIDVTPNLDVVGSAPVLREQEILRWMSSNRTSDERWLAID